MTLKSSIFNNQEQAELLIADDQSYSKKFKKGLTESLVREISATKNEPDWLLTLRLSALDVFQKISLPTWGPDISKLDFNNIRYFASASKKKHAKFWKDVDPQIKKTFEKLKIPEAERTSLAGVGAQYESENVYHNLKPKWEKKGIIFEDFDIAVQKYPDLVRKYFSKCIPIADHKMTALHYAVFSGGTFLFLPPKIEVDEPLQAYFRMNAINQGQFEHTLIIAKEGSKAHYIEGCSAPKYGSQALHVGCVEVFVEKHANLRYSSVENWSKDTYNLNTKRAIVQNCGSVEWIGGNLGSGITMLYPCSILMGDNARANHLGIAVATKDQNQDTGAKVIISGKNCRVFIKSKSVAKDGGITTYRGNIKVLNRANNATVNVECDALMIDNQSISDTTPQVDCQNASASVTHEAHTGKISDEVLFYFQTRGISKETAKGMVVNGFLDEVIKTLPLEYAGELNRIIELEMEGDI